MSPIVSWGYDIQTTLTDVCQCNIWKKNLVLKNSLRQNILLKPFTGDELACLAFFILDGSYLRR